MHLPLTLLLHVISLSLSLSQRLDSAAAKNQDQPSPEWIKYQQERFEHNSKTPILQDINNKTPHDPFKQKKEVNLNHQHKVETTSRHSEGNYDQQQEQFEFERTQQTEADQSTNNVVQLPSIKGFVEFLKSLKQTWLKNSIFRIDDKIKLLQNLKDSLFKTIEKQFMVLWHDDEEDDVDTTKQHLRRKRGILDESSINFPPYAALMSINFLTFSVFLIKLVLQVVNIIKSKHYQISSFNMVDTGDIRNTG